MDKRSLLVEYVDGIREGLSSEANLAEWLDDCDRFLLTEEGKGLDESVYYNFGRLLGAAEYVDMTVLELLDFHEIPLFIEPERPPCTVYSHFCDEHGFVHGAEAEELRKGVENLMRDFDCDRGFQSELQRLLDRVVARDSLAYLEAQERAEEATSDGACAPGCLGWFHANIGEDNEGIERCDECDNFTDDPAAARAHDKHCSCGAGWGKEIHICHGCQYLLSDSEATITIRNHRAFCSKICAA